MKTDFKTGILLWAVVVAILSGIIIIVINTGKEPDIEQNRIMELNQNDQ